MSLFLQVWLVGVGIIQWLDQTCLLVLLILIWLNRKMKFRDEAELAQGPTVGGNSLGSVQAQLCLSLFTPNQPLEHSGTNWQWLSQNLALLSFFSRN